MKQINKILLAEIKPQAWQLALIFFLIILGVGLESIAPWSFKLLIDNVLNGEPLNTGEWAIKTLSFISSKESLGFFAIAIYFGSTTLSDLFEYLVGVTTKKLNRSVIADFSQKAFNSLEQLSVGFFRKQQIGDYIYRLSYDVSALGNLMEEGILPLINNFFFLAVTITILFFINFQLAMLAMLMLPLLALTLWIFNPSIQKTSETSEKSNSLLFSFIEEVLGQLRIVQAFNKQNRESALFQQKQVSSLNQEMNMYGFGFLMNLLIGLIIAIAYSIILLFGVKLVFSGTLTAGLLIAFILYLDNLSQPLLNFVSSITTIKENYIKISRMGEFFDRSNKEHSSGKLVLEKSPNIEFKNITVSTGNNHYMVKNLSFNIPAGKKTVIVGVNGSGKTTITNLILGFLKQTSGEILLSGKSVHDYDLTLLRESVGFVPQEIILFDDSIRNNIAFGKALTDIKEIKEAAEKAAATDFILRLPGHFEFNVGEEGLNLSGGQRQRIMLARAFLKNKAKILILDEPLSALDIKTRKIVMHNLNTFAKGKTVVFISNVLEIVSQADHVIVLNQGNVMHSGTPKSILSKKSLSEIMLEEA